MSDRTLYRYDNDDWEPVYDDDISNYNAGFGRMVPVEPDYEVTYCPVHDVTWPVNHERCGLIVLAHYPEIDDE